MIIGGPNPNNSFNENKFKNNNLNNTNFSARKMAKRNGFVQGLSSFMHSNVINKDEMYDKSLAMLNERLANGTITLEEFNKKCAELGKRRSH